VGATVGLNRGRRRGERTVAGVEADDEARLLLDFLRHFAGGGVVDGRTVLVQRVLQFDVR
jgi:hypothetical protein